MLAVGLSILKPSAGADLDLSIRPVVSEKLKDSGVSVTRLDWFISGIALKREDGTWLEAASDWVAFFSVGEEKRIGSRTRGLEPGNFTGVRFRVGLDKELNDANPNHIRPDHPLHPDVNGLHWGWLQGYIFLAIEGRWSKAGSEAGREGFSFHLTDKRDEMLVELPVKFSSSSPVTLHLDLHIDRILRGIDFEKDGTSTHSREGDPLAARLMKNVEAAFSLNSVSSDIYHDVEFETPAEPPEGTTPYLLKVTSRFPKFKLPADNPLTQQGVALGKRLFHDSRLSVNNSQSCASCHVQKWGFSDPRRFSIGANEDVGTRQAMPLFNLAWASDFFWDGRAKTLREQVLGPIQAKNEMAESLERVVAKLESDDLYETGFEKAFGSAGITVDRLAMALEQFLFTLISQESKFDRAIRKLETFTDQEKRGFQLFITEFDPERGLRGADCFHCHGGNLFTNHRYFDNGLDLAPDDPGLMAVTGKEEDRGKFKTPSLRNIARTAPYMHDGRFKTLEEVVEHYSSGVVRSPNLDPNLAKHPVEGIGLTAEDKAALVAFLHTLTDERFLGDAGE